MATSCTDQNPLFVDAANGEASGLPSVDLRGQPRIQDGCVDIGAVESPYDPGMMLIVR